VTSPRLASRPAPAPQRPYVFPEVRRLSLAGGEVVAAHLPGQPLAWLGVVLGGGALAEPAPAGAGAALDGLSRATASLLDEGTENYTADEFGAAVESLGGHWGVDSGWQSTKVTIDVPVGRVGAGADLLAEAVRRPAFREVDTRRFLSDLASAKREQFARPGMRAQQALRGAALRRAGALRPAGRRHAGEHGGAGRRGGARVPRAVAARPRHAAGGRGPGRGRPRGAGRRGLRGRVGRGPAHPRRRGPARRPSRSWRSRTGPARCSPRCGSGTRCSPARS
jgi:hypothetical protein